MNIADLLIFISYVVTFFILGFALMWLWNTTLPDLFNIKKVSFWQALKILALSLILTGGVSLLGIKGEPVTRTIKLDMPK